MAKRTQQQRIDRLERIALGMGFLLVKLRHSYGADFGVGMTEQVDDAIRDFQQIQAAQAQRAKRKATEPNPQPRSKGAL